MKKTFLILCLGLAAGAAELMEVSNSELESVSAQGFNINAQSIDAFTHNNAQFDNHLMLNMPSSVHLVDSIMISGAAQQGAFAPVNAVNSAVNVPINIVFVMNSQIQGGVNISNVLNSALNN